HGVVLALCAAVRSRLAPDDRQGVHGDVGVVHTRTTQGDHRAVGQAGGAYPRPCGQRVALLRPARQAARMVARTRWSPQRTERCDSAARLRQYDVPTTLRAILPAVPVLRHGTASAGRTDVAAGGRW